MARREPTTDDIRQWWLEERDKRSRADLHNALDQILDCPYDNVKLAVSTVLDAMLEVKFAKDAEAVDRER